MASGDDLISKIDRLSNELNNSRTSTDIIAGRRECTRLLNQLKSVLHQISKTDCLSIVSNSLCDDGFADSSVLTTLFSIVDNEDEFSTEGHRETSVELLKEITGGAFRSDADVNLLDGDSASSSDCKAQQEQSIPQLITLFRQCSASFQKRMQRKNHGSSNKDSMIESCEHIRLLLVQLMIDVSTFLYQSTNGCLKAKVVLEVASISCYTLGKTALFDRFPDVQRASCSLVEILAKLCPLAVRMTASTLLLPLAGNHESYSTLKNSLFRHRHAKMRCKAVEASAAILLCCPKDADGLGGIQHNEEFAHIAETIPSQMASAQGTNHGSKSSSVEQLMHDTVLCGWEELIKLDPSATVRQVTLQALGKVASVMGWNYSLDKKIEERSHSKGCNSTKSSTSLFSTLNLVSVVETKVLWYFLLGVSDRNSQVRTLAVKQLRSFHNNSSSLLWDTIMRYYQPVLELALEQCSSQDVVECQSKVRSIEALIVLLSFIVALSNAMTNANESKLIVKAAVLSASMIDSIVEVLTDAILSDEKDVLDASLRTCRILGSIDELALSILSQISHMSHGISTTEEKAMTPTPRRSASTLLLLDGMMKGELSNNELTSILHDVDSSMHIPAPSWFCQRSAATICQLLASDFLLNNVATHSSLAWALLDSVSSLVLCTKQLVDGKYVCKLTEDSTVSILTCITYLIGCPDEFQISAHAKTVLNEMLSLDTSVHIADSQSNSSSSSLLDRYFRVVAMKIQSSAPFPWKRSDPSLLAIAALFRNSKGSTVSSNFDLVAPLFLYHLSEKKDDSIGNQSTGDKELLVTKEDPTEGYLLRISLMSLLQVILSDTSFSERSTMPYENAALASSSTQFTFDVTLSMVLPNLVWKSGGLAAALRKLSAATLFNLLSRHCNYLENIEHEMYKFILPILHSNLDDTESSTRELSCASLSLILKEMPTKTFQELWDQDTPVIDTIHTRLLDLLDDCHDSVRLATCATIERYLILLFASQDNSNCLNCTWISVVEDIAKRLVLALDDPDTHIQTRSLEVLTSYLSLLQPNRDIKLIAIIEQFALKGQRSHRDRKHCEIIQRLCSQKSAVS